MKNVRWLIEEQDELEPDRVVSALETNLRKKDHPKCFYHIQTILVKISNITYSTSEYEFSIFICSLLIPFRGHDGGAVMGTAHAHERTSLVLNATVTQEKTGVGDISMAKM